ncbi:hypothetical protein ONZ43_g1158 [Nemania bipapillata]|uniref:Uncharacterized protein n=1 Tax=Nemania bipapillata TaxID=110536 RepID=A0ACC2J6B4_9PEZI|nr:hypothetical protein ONZ43_g1158 [Nemania bipapillata]
MSAHPPCDTLIADISSLEASTAAYVVCPVYYDTTTAAAGSGFYGACAAGTCGSTVGAGACGGAAAGVVCGGEVPGSILLAAEPRAARIAEEVVVAAAVAAEEAVVVVAEA